MSAGGWVMVFVVLLTFGTLGFVVYSMAKSMRNERDRRRSVWKEFGLSLSLLILFLVSWVGQAMTQWQAYTDEQGAHGEPTSLGDFLGHFGASTLENWQSEFLQLFTFVALAALYVHKGSAESKDGTEKMEASLRRLEEKLGTLPPDAPTSKQEGWKLPDTPQQLAG